MNDFVKLEYIYEEVKRNKRIGHTCLQACYCYSAPNKIKKNK